MGHFSKDKINCALDFDSAGISASLLTNWSCRSSIKEDLDSGVALKCNLVKTPCRFKCKPQTETLSTSGIYCSSWLARALGFTDGSHTTSRTNLDHDAQCTGCYTHACIPFVESMPVAAKGDLSK